MCYTKMKEKKAKVAILISNKNYYGKQVLHTD